MGLSQNADDACARLMPARRHWGLVSIDALSVAA
jgi:hypothetical protein